MMEADFTRDFLSASRVVIWGLGLMGGSLAMALKGKCAELIGIDIDPRAVDRALNLDIVDRAATSPGDILAGAGIVVLAVPVGAILELISALPGLCPDPAVVIDLGSTKRAIVSAMDGLPDRFDPVGGHPMCGKEKSSIEYAEVGLYEGAPFGLVALERTSSRTKALAESMALSVGARPVWMTASGHDQMVAATSHVPFLLANALAQATPLEAAPMVGPGFRSTSRLAGSSSRMMMDILKTNADNIRVAIAQVMNALTEYETLLTRSEFQILAEILDDSAERYQYLSQGGMQ